MDALDFWKEMRRKAALFSTKASCSQVINELVVADAANFLTSIINESDVQDLPSMLVFNGRGI
ncbi:hypothetical protein DM01DRAFT_1334929 [Hesseltinella vesiculosa]|uniref:Uncharacterized protein n=1 Tax=Hesseltinella vesiculosa TaxID=101127 RepID=A0A1X2GLG8_9FUNG|nr:hypothetical protein DM01DRAFT_1334929 [Hesseltinella vesiculosa]